MQLIRCLCCAAELPSEPVKPPQLARLPLPENALQALKGKAAQVTAAKEKQMLALEDAATASVSADDKLFAQDQQVQQSHLLVL